MARYQFWDKQSDLYTPNGMCFSASQYLEMNSWAKIPGVKCVISTGPINCAVFMEFGALRDMCVQQGMEIPEGASDEEILALIEAWETRVVETAPTAEERIAAALEYQNISSMPDATTEEVTA